MSFNLSSITGALETLWGSGAAELPAMEHGLDSITVEYAGRSREFGDISLGGGRELSRRLSREFGSPTGAVLRRADDGVVVPASPELPPGRYTLEDPSRGPQWGGADRGSQPKPEGGAGAGPGLEWAQEPPHGSVVWLHAKTSVDGGVVQSCLQHCFHPAPAVRLAAAAGLPLAEQRRLLGAVAVRLYDAELRDVTAGCLHEGRREFVEAAGGGAALAWPAMAITKPSSAVASVGVGSHIAARELGGTTRGAKGYYHLAVTAPAAATLWLAGADGAPARLVVKSERLAGLGLRQGDGRSWREKGLGPFADHGACTPSHFAPGGRCLCLCSATAVKPEPR